MDCHGGDLWMVMEETKGWSWRRFMDGHGGDQGMVMEDYRRIFGIDSGMDADPIKRVRGNMG